MNDAFHWPNNAEGAVSLSFDDGIPCHHQLVTPRLEKHDLRGTFYINPRNAWWEEHIPAWVAAHQAGHELGNHTLSHPCCLNAIGREGLASWTRQRMEQDILAAQRLLDAALPQPRPCSFAYPCYESDVGHGLNRQSYVPVVARHFTTARAGGRSKDRPNHPLHCDLHHLSCHAVEDYDGQQLIGASQAAIAHGGWVILTFHAIEGGYLSVTLHHFQRLLEYLTRESRLWVAPVIDVGTHLARWRTP